VKNLALIVIACMAAVVLAWVLWLFTPSERYRVYDCSLAEFHPDYPQAVREECRKLKRTGYV
jgi:hypothetical protein